MGKIDVIPLFPLLGVNHRLHILHISKILVYLYTKYKRMNTFSIGYMINLVLHVHKVFRYQVGKCLRATFHQSTMEDMKKFMRKRNTCVIAIVMFYETKTKKYNKSV